MPRGIKNQVTELQLESIRRFYSDGHTLEETAQEHGLSYGYLYKKFKEMEWLRGRGHRVNPGIAQGFDDSDLLKFKGEWDKLDSTTKGSIAENYVKIKLMELGFDVWEPAVQNHKTDLIILFDRNILKIQVKSATYDIKIKSFRGNLMRHRRGSGQRLDYSVDDVDFFIFYCGGLLGLEFYIVPMDIIRKIKNALFYPHRRKSLMIHPDSVPLEVYRNAFHLLRQ